MSYFIAPRSGEKTYRKNESTLTNGVPYENIERYLTDEGKKKVLTEEIIYAWGNRPGTKAQWEHIQIGDTIIFYSKGELVMTGEVYHKQHHAQLAEAMWPVDDEDTPWEYTFFVKNLKYIRIPIQAFFKAAHYDPKFIVRGFIYLKDYREQFINQEYGSVENFINSFRVSRSDENLDADEAIYVNVSDEIKPEIIKEPVISPRTINEELKKSERHSYKRDYIARSKANAITGSKGEELVLKEEIRRLKSLDRIDLADKVKRVSVTDDSLGYDILSYEEDGNERFIEVKTSTAKSKSIRFFMSKNEHDAATTLRNYYVYFVDGVNEKTPRITHVEDPIKRDQFLVSTDTYLVEGVRK